MSNCKVGDLAIIVKDNGLQENLGITVQIVAHAGYMNWYGYSLRLKRSYKRPRRAYSWRVVALSNKGICYGNHKGELYFSHEGDVPDYCLQRLPKIQFTNEEFAEEGIKIAVICEVERSNDETVE